jgi:hypothetical protein
MTGGEAVWNVSCLLVSPPVVSGFRGVGSQTRDASRSSFDDEYTLSDETQDLFSAYVDACLCCFLVEGGGSKLSFGEENPEFDLWLDSSSSVHVHVSFLKA